MTEIEFMNTNNLDECYQIHNLYRKEFAIGDFKEFRTLKEAEDEGYERLNSNEEIIETIIRRFFRKDGHIYYDGIRRWIQTRD